MAVGCVQDMDPGASTSVIQPPGGLLRYCWQVPTTRLSGVAPQLLTTSNFIGPWYHAALLFSGLGSIVLLFGVLFSQQIREDLVRAATSPAISPTCPGTHGSQ